jgi:hypothetical protein
MKTIHHVKTNQWIIAFPNIANNKFRDAMQFTKVLRNTTCYDDAWCFVHVPLRIYHQFLRVPNAFSIKTQPAIL